MTAENLEAEYSANADGQVDGMDESCDPVKCPEQRSTGFGQWKSRSGKEILFQIVVVFEALQRQEHHAEHGGHGKTDSREAKQTLPCRPGSHRHHKTADQKNRGVD